MGKDKKGVSPADAFRKAQKKKELNKNKTERKRARDEKLGEEDTDELKGRIYALEKQLKLGILDGPGRKKLQELQDKLPRVVAAKTAAPAAAATPAAAAAEEAPGEKRQAKLVPSTFVQAPPPKSTLMKTLTELESQGLLDTAATLAVGGHAGVPLPPPRGPDIMLNMTGGFAIGGHGGVPLPPPRGPDFMNMAGGFAIGGQGGVPLPPPRGPDASHVMNMAGGVAIGGHGGVPLPPLRGPDVMNMAGGVAVGGQGGVPLPPPRGPDVMNMAGGVAIGGQGGVPLPPPRGPDVMNMAGGVAIGGQGGVPLPPPRGLLGMQGMLPHSMPVQGQGLLPRPFLPFGGPLMFRPPGHPFMQQAMQMRGMPGAPPHLLHPAFQQGAGLPPFGGMHGIPGPPPLPLQQHPHPSDLYEARNSGPPQPRAAPTDEQNALGGFVGDDTHAEVDPGVATFAEQDEEQDDNATPAAEEAAAADSSDDSDSDVGHGLVNYSESDESDDEQASAQHHDVPAAVPAEQSSYFGPTPVDRSEMDAFMYPEAPGPDMPDSEPGALEAAPAEEEPSNHIDAAVIAFIPAAVRRNKLAAAGPVKASKPLLKPAPGPRRPTYMTHPEPGVMPGGALSYVTPTAAKEGVAILGQPQEKPKNNQDFADFMKELGELGAFES